MQVSIHKVTATNAEFTQLVKELDAYLKITDGEEHAFYNQFNTVDVLQHIIILKINNTAVGCGALKKYNTTTAEIKRMYVKPAHRGKKLAQKIMKALEDKAKELGYKSCILETGIRQKEAVAFYNKCNYVQIPQYGQYKGMENSICFEKQLP